VNVELLSHWGNDRTIAESAWVSTGLGFERSDGDVKRLIEEQIIPLDHVTPLESVWFRYHVRCPIFVERQIDKTRMSNQDQDIQAASFGRHGITQNELSGRYRTLPTEFMPMPDDVAAICDRAGVDSTAYDYALDKAGIIYRAQVASIKAAADRGAITVAEYRRAREIMRGILGTSTYTEMHLTLNLNTLFTLAEKRLAADAQPETRWIVEQMIRLASDICPIAINKKSEIEGWKL
jgi:thymidylate synthase (FAD)